MTLSHFAGGKEARGGRLRLATVGRLPLGQLTGSRKRQMWAGEVARVYGAPAACLPVLCCPPRSPGWWVGESVSISGSGSQACGSSCGASWEEASRCGGGGSSSQPQEVGAGRGAQAQKNRKAGVVWHPEARGSPPRGRENETQVCEHRLREAGTCPTPASCKSETLCLFRLPARPSSGSVFSTVAGRAASLPAQFSCVHR